MDSRTLLGTHEVASLQSHYFSLIVDHIVEKVPLSTFHTLLTAVISLFASVSSCRCVKMPVSLS